MADRTVSVALQLKTAGFTNGLRKAQQDTKKFGDDLSSRAKKNRDGLNDVATGLAGVGLAAGLAAVGAVKKFADFDKQMSAVRAATHATAGDMGLLKDAALEAGAKTAFSATEAAAAIENLAKAGVSTSDILNGGLNGALDLAAAGELDVAQAAETAATAMTQFGLSGQEVPHIADLLAAAAGKAQGEVSDMAAALNQSGLVAAQMGLSIEETTGTLAAFASAGLLGSDAGTSFKTMLLALANPSKEAAGTMKELGIHAYDAQGAFVGIAPLAEQLKTKLGSLSQEQRDSTLATIFGSDAIRAAAILYKQGSGGVQDWTTKVNDAGFAAETAAIKQDNLRGDIEKLGGSLETALIKGGSGANDTLRGLTKTAEAAVTGFSELPPVVTQGATALAGIGAVGALSAAGLIKGVNAASDLRESWQGLSRAGKTLTYSLGAVGVAISAGLVVYGHFAKRNAEAEQKVEDLKSTLDEQTGAITKNTRAYVANELAQNGMAQTAKDLGLNLALVTDAALGNETALYAVKLQLDRVIEANDRYGRGSQDSASEKLAEDAKMLSAELFGMNGNLTDAQKKQRLAAEGAKEHESAQTLQAEAVKKSNTQIKQQAEDLKKQTEAAFAAAGGALSLRSAQNSYEESLDAVSESLKNNGRGLDVTTEKGRANRETLDTIAASANDVTEAMIANGGSHDTARAKAITAREEFVKVAVRMGLNKAAAKALADQLIAIPPKATTNVTNNAAGKPKTDVEKYQEVLEHNPNEKNTNFTTSGIPKAWRDISTFSQNVDTSLSGIADETITVTARLNAANIGQKNANDRRLQGVGMAEGGGVFGGERGKDSVPAMLMPDEHVWTTRETAAAGGHGAMKRLRNAALRGELRGLAAGGSVRLSARTPTPEEVAHMSASLAAAAVAAVRPAAQQAADKAFAVSGNPGSARTFRGKRLNELTIARLLNAERMLGAQFHITQGSYSTSVAASGGTHSGGGAMDTNGPGGWGAAVRALRSAGFAAWHRTPSQGPWGHHIHSIAIGDSSASPSAKRQVQSYLQGGNGLGRGMANGGKPLVLDSGGMLPTGPSFVYNGTGKSETVRTAEQESALRGPQDLSDRTIRAVGKEFARAFAEGKFRVVGGSGGSYVLQMSNG